MDMAVRGRLFFNDITNMAQRVTFYIDGFNFYYGLRRTKRNEPAIAVGHLGYSSRYTQVSVPATTGKIDAQKTISHQKVWSIQ